MSTASTSPTWEIANPEAPLDDQAIDALAALLLDLAESETERTEETK